MLHYLILLGMLSHSFIYCSSATEYDLESQCNWELEDECSSYCFRMMRPLLGYAKQRSGTEDKFIELQNQAEQYKREIEKLKSELSELKIKSSYNDKDQLSCIRFGNSNGIHTVYTFVKHSFEVFCDSKIAGNGWTVIQRRINGDVKFNRNWQVYKSGFGDLNGSFFIGLNILHLMTKDEPHELYIQLKDIKGNTKYAQYDAFSVGDESEGFQIKSLGKYTGTAGDSLREHLHLKFSTFDHNFDPNNNCGAWLNGGWWYKSCGFCNLNGLYIADGSTKNFQGIMWTTFTNYNQSLGYVQMMIRSKSKYFL